MSMENEITNLVSAEEMRWCEKNTIERFHMPAAVLMERAALGTFETVREYWRKSTGRVLIVAGTGNNGADGIAVGRLLAQAGFEVTFLAAGEREKFSGLLKSQISIIEAYGFEVITEFPETEYDIIVDALFGIGLSRNLDGIWLLLTEKINKSSAFKVSVDMPSGIHTDTGAVMGGAVRADVTVTFGCCKLGLVLYPGAEYAGKVVLKEIGITRAGFLGKLPKVFTQNQTAQLLPIRPKDGNKGTFGKALVIAGSKEIIGACLLSAEAAFRIGCGMVKILTPKENRTVLALKLPEAMLQVYDTKKELKMQLKESCLWADCILIGPGCGVGPETEEKLSFVIEKCEKPLVIDADGLNQIAENESLYHSLKKSVEKTKRPVILTPHLGEFSRLTGTDVKNIKENLLKETEKYAAGSGCIVVCKDTRTVVAASGHSTYLNLSGNCGMASAGCGDVLAGMIVGLLAQVIKKAGKTCQEKQAAFEAAVAGVYLHGLAGDEACKADIRNRLENTTSFPTVYEAGREERTCNIQRYKNEYTLLAEDLIKQFDSLFRTGPSDL